MNITSLGEPRFDSPLTRFVDEQARVPARLLRYPDRSSAAEEEADILFELAGPRRKLFFRPETTRAGIVTCGGLCPGLNNVIRSLFQELHHSYRIRDVLGFRDGYRGLDPSRGKEPVVLTPEFVEDIHREGGTVLGTSRGPVDTAVAVENLIRRQVDILFTIGGDGTQRGGNELFQEARRRGHPLAVVGLPKTVDNDVAFVSRTFGYLTAVEEAVQVLQRAHNEAHSVENGISLVKLMGRHAGFIAAGATVASQEVNFTLVPEIPFKLEGPEGFLAHLERRIRRRAHALIVVAEGAGQDLLAACANDKDASGNVRLKDIGLFLREQIEAHFARVGLPMVFRYFDPNYLVRSVPADAEDSIICDVFARHAAHAAMAGKTGLIIGLVHDRFVHVSIEEVVKHQKRLSPDGELWHAVLATTGQPERFA